MKVKRDPSTKPYYRCFTCPRFRNTCGGRPTRDMDLKEWCEYIRDIKEYFNLSNSYLTETAKSSESTTERIMAGNTDQDIMRSTARRYEMAAIGPVGEFSCYLDRNNVDTGQIAALQAELEAVKKDRDRLAKIIDKYLD